MTVDATFWDHLEVLRWTLIKMGVVFLVFFILSIFFHSDVLMALEKPYRENGVTQFSHTGLQETNLRIMDLYNPSSEEMIYRSGSEKLFVLLEAERGFEGPIKDLVIPAHGRVRLLKEDEQNRLVLFGPMDGISLIMKISFFLSLILSLPLNTLLFIDFLRPGLKERELFRFIPLLLLSFVFAGTGLMFAYFILLPLGNEFFYSLNSKIGHNFWSLESYISYCLLLLFSGTISFEFLLLILILVHFQWISKEFLEEKRRYFVVLSFVLGAVLTPPDVPSQMLFAGLLIIFYEVGYLYSVFRAKKKRWKSIA